MKRGSAPPGRRDVILELLRASAEPRGVASIADELGIHPNTVRFHLEALCALAASSESSETTPSGRPRTGYRQPPDGPDGSDELSGTGQHLPGYLRPPRCPGIAAALGRSTTPAWSRPPRTPRAVENPRGDRLVAMLASWILRPNPQRTTCARIRLRHCPFPNSPNHTARSSARCTWASCRARTKSGHPSRWMS